MDDYNAQPSALMEAVRQRTEDRAVKRLQDLRLVGQDKDTGERLLIDDETRQLYIAARSIVQAPDGKLKAVERLLRCEKSLVPTLLGVVMTGFLGAPPLPIIMCFEGGVQRPVHVDALQF